MTLDIGIVMNIAALVTTTGIVMTNTVLTGRADIMLPIATTQVVATVAMVVAAAIAESITESQAKDSQPRTR